MNADNKPTLDDFIDAYNLNCEITELPKEKKRLANDEKYKKFDQIGAELTRNRLKEIELERKRSDRKYQKVISLLRDYLGNELALAIEKEETIITNTCEDKIIVINFLHGYVTMIITKDEQFTLKWTPYITEWASKSEELNRENFLSQLAKLKLYLNK